MDGNQILIEQSTIPVEELLNGNTPYFEHDIEATNTEKRVRVLIYQLPDDLVTKFEDDGHFDLMAESNRLFSWKEKALGLLYNQSRYTEDDVVEAYVGYFSRLEGARG